MIHSEKAIKVLILTEPKSKPDSWLFYLCHGWRVKKRNFQSNYWNLVIYLFWIDQKPTIVWIKLIHYQWIMWIFSSTDFWWLFSRLSGLCLRVPCKTNEECPNKMKCHEDLKSTFCSGFVKLQWTKNTWKWFCDFVHLPRLGFTCKTSEDCNDKENCFRNSEGDCINLKVIKWK